MKAASFAIAGTESSQPRFLLASAPLAAAHAPPFAPCTNQKSLPDQFSAVCVAEVRVSSSLSEGEWFFPCDLHKLESRCYLAFRLISDQPGKSILT